MQKITEFITSYWKKFLLNDPIAIDATLGNGYDTLHLARHMAGLSEGKGKIYGYDIQDEAISRAKILLNDSLTEKERDHIILKKKSHETFDELQADLIVYNLGYLPRSDKKVTTTKETTLLSLQSALHIVRGAISLLCYVGHEEGEREYEMLGDFFKKLDPQNFSVCQMTWLNRHKAPVFFWCEKISH